MKRPHAFGGEGEDTVNCRKGGARRQSMELIYANVAGIFSIFAIRSTLHFSMHQQTIAERLLEELREKLDSDYFEVRDRTSRKSPKKHPPF